MKTKRMKVKEFREIGFLQEVNRQFFHPLGLALEIIVKCKESPNVADSGEMLIGGIWDYRDDPEGMTFGKDMIEKNKIERVEQLRTSKLKARINHPDFKSDKKGIQIK